MTGSNLLKGKYERNDEATQGDYLEGTSARTRPFSFDDIMLARKKKADGTKQVICGPPSGATDIAQDGKSSSSEFHKKTNEDSDTKHTLVDFQKSNALGKGDTSASRENKKLVSDRDKGSQEHYPKLKSVVDKNTSNDRITEVKNERRYHHNKEKHAGEKDGDRKQSRGLVKKEKGSETSRGKSEMDRKQVHNNYRQVSRKRKTDDHATTDSRFKKRIERGMMFIDKSTDRVRDKSQKEVRHKHHNEDDRTRGRSTGQKHGLEEKEKEVEPTRAYHGDSRSTGGRSRSKEHAKERGSQSPVVHKHKSINKKEHGELSSNSTKDRSGKENSDVDKRISSNGSSNQYRRNNASSSGLGGYSPRKRKTDAAAKTPSPTHRSPAKRTAGWDLQPHEKESAIAGLTFSGVHTTVTTQNLSMSIQDSPNGTPVPPIVMKPVGISPVGISPHSLSSQMHAIESIQLTQATRPMRRLYVENLPASTSEKDLIESINKFLLSSGVNYIQGTQPCISCIIHKEKGQALLEFLTPEDASAALSFDGIFFSGSHLKFRRPKDFSTISTGVLDKSVVAVDSVCDNVEDSPHKIFIGGISKFISAKMLLEIARAFGPVKAFHYEHITDINEQCAFLEYADHSVTSKACAGLNGMRLGGKVVTAVFATPEAAMVDVGNLPFYGIPEHAKPLLEIPSAVLRLKNALDPEDLLLLSESELEEILEDIRIECSRFGTVKSINVVKPTKSPGTKEADAKTANASINGWSLACENTNSETEKLGENTDEVVVLDQSDPTRNNSGFDDCTSISNVCAESEGTVGSSLPHENADNLVKDEMCKTIKGSQQIYSVDEMERNNNAADSISPRNVEREELKLEENNMKDGGLVEQVTIERRELDSSEANNKDSPNNSGNVFEPGCVFVEYRRAEAACMAAHCLHERLFDGRVVTVAYVSLDLYQMRFRK